MCKDDSFKQEKWYKELTDYQKILINDLKLIQLKAGVDEPLESQQNHIRSDFIKSRIDDILPSKNFFFFKIFEGDSKEVETLNEMEK